MELCQDNGSVVAVAAVVVVVFPLHSCSIRNLGLVLFVSSESKHKTPP